MRAEELGEHEASEAAELRHDAPLGSHRARVKHLDGLRGFAAVCVVCDHYLGPMGAAAGAQQILGRIVTPGWLGVDVFFPLSGFLITGILLDEPKNSGFFSSFYIRRGFRLLPLYYAYLTLLFALQLSTHTVEGRNLLANALYVQNFYLAKLGHWTTGTGYLWSLAVEEQFYLVWPMLVYWLSKRALAAVILSGGALSFVLRCLLMRTGHGFAAYVLIFSHMDGLCMGALAALTIRGMDPFRMRHGLRLLKVPAAIALVLLMVFVRRVAEDSRIFGVVAPVLVAILATSLILHPGRLARLLESRSLRWIGKYSYAVYVLQSLTGFTFQHWLFRHTLSFPLRLLGMVAMFGLLLLEARLSWAILEGPMMRLRERLFPTRTTRSHAPHALS